MIAFLEAQVVDLIAGVLLLLALGAWRMPLGLFIPAAWIGGTGLLAAEHLVLAQAGVPWNAVSLGLPWLAVAALAVRRVWAQSNGHRTFTLPDIRQMLPKLKQPVILIEALVGVVIIVWTIKLLAVATSVPVAGFDAQVDWLFKGRAIYNAGGLPIDFYTDPNFAKFAHLDYPPFVPLAVAQTYAWTGDNDILAKGWWALLGGAMTLGVYFGLRGHVGMRARLGGLVLLLGTPEVLNHAANGLAGYAELPMAVLFLYGALFLYRWMKQPTSADFILTALFFSLTGFTKNEGIIVAVVGLALLFGIGLARKRLTWEGTVLATMFAVLIMVPWQVEKQVLGITGDLHPTLAGVLANWNARFGLIMDALAYNTRDVERLNLIWALLPLLALCALVFAPRRWAATLPLLALIAAHLAAATVAYLTTPYDIHWHLGTSADRVVFQSTLVAALLSVIYLGMIFDTKDPVVQMGT